MCIDLSRSDLQFLVDAFNEILGITCMNDFKSALIPIFERGIRADSISAIVTENGNILECTGSTEPNKPASQAPAGDPVPLQIGGWGTENTIDTDDSGSRVGEQARCGIARCSTVRSGDQSYEMICEIDLARLFQPPLPPGEERGIRSEDDRRLILRFVRGDSAFSSRERELMNRLQAVVCRTLLSLLLVQKLEKVSRLLEHREVRTASGAPELLQELGLSRREAEVLWWAAEGKSNKEIALILGVSFRTIQKHIENILRKLEVEHRHASVVHALRWLDRHSGRE